MDIMKEVRELIAAARDFYVAFQAGDVPAMVAKGSAAVVKTLAIIAFITQGLGPQPMFAAGPAKQSAYAAHADETVEELADSLESCCHVHGTQSTAVGGPFIDAILPILLALLKKLLGF